MKRFRKRASGLLAAGFVALATSASPAFAQLKSPAERIEELEERVRELEKDLKKLEEDVDDVKDGDFFAEGLIMLGGTELRLGGKVELLLIDNESDSFAPLGSAGVTDNPDPHLDLQRLRIYPRIDLNRWISVRGQVDIKPVEGSARLKELVVRHDVDPAWWFDSRFQIGLDDRFIRPSRRTESYPLIGQMIWRDESLAFTWRVRFGDKDGPPAEDDGDGGEKKKRKQALPTGPEDDGAFDDSLEGGGGNGEIGPFDFARNWGEVRLYLSLGQGYVLDRNEIQFDRAAFNDIVQDDEEFEDDLSLRELGVGLEYRRSFQRFGELSAMGFLYNDELRDGSVQFLQEDLTLRDPGNVALAGYGDSNSRRSYRYGAQVEYFLPASTIFESVLETRGQDGLRLFAQFVNAFDGDLERKGWYVQGSYRFSFGRLLLDRYFRSFEPVVRYGRINVDLSRSPLPQTSPVPELPGTWDRKALVVGGILEVTGDIYAKIEYVFNDEETGDRSVDNDVFFVDLILDF